MNLTGCTSPKWDYYDFQYQFLKFVKELDLSAMVANGQQDQRERELKERIAENRAKTEELGKRLNRILTMIETSDSPPQTLLQRMREIESELVGLNVGKNPGRRMGSVRSWPQISNSQQGVVSFPDGEIV